MGRPVYETRQDIGREANVAEILAAAWSCAIHKLPRLYSCDYAAMRGKEVSAWLEIKCRNASYPTYLISLHKWIKGIELSEATAKPFLLVVSWPVNGEQVVMFYPVCREPIHVVLGGRKDRNDPDDIEPMVEVPVAKFRRLK